MTGISLPTARAMATAFPWGEYKTFADVGCAQGGLPVEIARAHAHLAGCGFDVLPLLVERHVGGRVLLVVVAAGGAGGRGRLDVPLGPDDTTGAIRRRTAAGEGLLLHRGGERGVGPVVVAQAVGDLLVEVELGGHLRGGVPGPEDPVEDRAVHRLR